MHAFNEQPRQRVVFMDGDHVEEVGGKDGGGELDSR